LDVKFGPSFVMFQHHSFSTQSLGGLCGVEHVNWGNLYGAGSGGLSLFADITKYCTQAGQFHVSGIKVRTDTPSDIVKFATVECFHLTLLQFAMDSSAQAAKENDADCSSETCCSFNTSVLPAYQLLPRFTNDSGVIVESSLIGSPMYSPMPRFPRVYQFEKGEGGSLPKETLCESLCVTEYIPGSQSLAEHIAQHVHSQQQVYHLMRAAINLLIVLRQARIVHGNLNPRSLIVVGTSTHCSINSLNSSSSADCYTLGLVGFTWASSAVAPNLPARTEGGGRLRDLRYQHEESNGYISDVFSLGTVLFDLFKTIELRSNRTNISPSPSTRVNASGEESIGQEDGEATWILPVLRYMMRVPGDGGSSSSGGSSDGDAGSGEVDWASVFPSCDMRTPLPTGAGAGVGAGVGGATRCLWPLGQLQHLHELLNTSYLAYTGHRQAPLASSAGASSSGTAAASAAASPAAAAASQQTPTRTAPCSNPNFYAAAHPITTDYVANLSEVAGKPAGSGSSSDSGTHDHDNSGVTAGGGGGIPRVEVHGYQSFVVLNGRRLSSSSSSSSAAPALEGFGHPNNMDDKEGQDEEEEEDNKGLGRPVAGVVIQPTSRPLGAKDRLISPILRATVRGLSVMDVGGNFGFFCLRSLQFGASAATLVDMDTAYTDAAQQVVAHLGPPFSDRLAVRNIKLEEVAPAQADVVVALALIHWVYSCSEGSSSLARALGRLSRAARKVLVVEWVDPLDPVIVQHRHSQNQHQHQKQRNPEVVSPNNVSATLDEGFTSDYTFQEFNKVIFQLESI
jgi:hypothetical protein